MTTDTSHDETVSYDTHADLVVEHAQTLKQLNLVECDRNNLRVELEQTRELMCEDAGDLAGLELALSRRDDAVSNLRHQLGCCNATIRELEEQVAELREQVASRTIAIEERDRVVSEQRTLRANTYRTERDHYQKRAQQAEAERDTVKAKLHRVLTDLNGLKAANDEMGRKMEEDAARIASLESEISTSEAEFSALKEAPDAVA